MSSQTLRRTSRRVPADAFGAPSLSPKDRKPVERGQALALFVILSLVMIGSVAIVTDVSWLWYGNQRMQRAADAAALAGAIYLPGNPALAYSTARDEATKNGFTNGINGVTVTPLQDTINKRRLNVTVTGSVGAFFAQALGISSFASSATGRAEYYLPVPMGSPENYYGVFGMTRGIATAETVTNTNTTSAGGDTGLRTPTTAPSRALGRRHRHEAGSGPEQRQRLHPDQHERDGPAIWDSFGISLPNPNANQSLSIVGLTAILTDTSCRRRAPTRRSRST